MDRLITEIKLSPLEAYHHCRQIIENANVIMSNLMSADSLANESVLDIDEKDERRIFFSPSKCNVLFSSAIDGWAFSLGYFASYYSEKLNQKPSFLRQVFWGDYCYSEKSKSFIQLKANMKQNPAFVQYVLTPIWHLYDACENNMDKLKRMIKKLNLDIPEKELQQTDHKSIINSVFRRWLPLSDTAIHIFFILIFKYI